MSCQKVQKSISAFLDQALGQEERESVSLHLNSCRECAVKLDEMGRLRKAVRGLPVLAAPARLASELRVMASHERARRAATATLSGRLSVWADRMSLWIDNLMRPVALPFAGGLLSALFLFGMLVPTLGFRHNISNDVPISLYTEASLEEIAPFILSDDETVVELTIDQRGQVTDFTLPKGQDSRQLELTLANTLLLSRFSPATWFGQPTSGKITVSFRRYRYVVKG